MATDDATATGGGFGRVSRTVGTVFRYFLLAATLAGIVALGVLLAFVTNAALRPFTADPAWLAVFALAVIALPVGTGAWLYRTRPPAFRTGLGALGLVFVGLLYGGGVVILFVDVLPPVVWLSFVVALAIPAVLALALERLDRRLSFLLRTVAVTVVGALSLWQVPALVQTIPVLPADWFILLLTVGGPAAAMAAWYVRGRFEDRRATVAAGFGSFAVAAAAGYAGVATGIGGTATTVLVTSVTVSRSATTATPAVRRALTDAPPWPSRS